MMVFLQIVMWLVVWGIIALTTYGLLILSVALEANESFVKVLFEGDVMEINCIVFSILFPIGIGIFIFTLCMLYIKPISFGDILKKIFEKKYIRNKVMEEI